MNIKIDSTLLLNNFNVFNELVQKVYEKDYYVIKNKGESFDLKDDEFTFLIINDAIYHKYIVDYYTDKHHSKYKEQMQYKGVNKVKKYKINIYLTNKYLHFDQKNIEKIKLSDITELEISPKFLTIYTKKNIKSVIFTGKLDIAVTISVLIEILIHTKISPDAEGKNVKFSYQKNNK